VSEYGDHFLKKIAAHFQSTVAYSNVITYNVVKSCLAKFWSADQLQLHALCVFSRKCLYHRLRHAIHWTKLIVFIPTEC